MPRKTAVGPVVIGVPGDDLPLSHRKPTLLLFDGGACHGGRMFKHHLIGTLRAWASKFFLEAFTPELVPEYVAAAANASSWR